MDYISANFDFDHSESYFSVYNADSKPGQNVLLSFQRTAEANNSPEIMQEYSAFISNIEELSTIMKVFAIYQTNFEMTNGLVNSVLSSNLLRNHVVGHGLFIRYDYLEQIGGFTTKYWCEDIYLSFYLRSSGVQIHALNSVEIGEAPRTLKILIKQNANWFKTLSETFNISKSLSNSGMKNKFRSKLFLLNQLRGAVAWAVLPSVYLALEFWLILSQFWGSAVLGLLVYLITTTGRFYFSTLLSESVLGYSIESKLKMSLYAAFAYLISNVGPVYGLFHRNAKKYKTER